MHLAIIIWSFFVALIWADWKRWKEFLPTMYYMVIGNLIYQYIAHTHYHLWQYERVLYNETVTDNLYTFIVFPCTVMLFLSNYPKTLQSQLLHFMKWIGTYVVFEWIGGKYGFIAYQHGWSLGWSILFNILMFLMLRLHHVKPLWAVTISPLIISILMIIFY